MPVFASEGVYDPDTSWWEKFVEESSAYIAYLCCRVGAVVKDYDFAKWVQTREDYKEWWNTGHISRLEDSSGNVSYSFDKELMAYIKQCLDEYAKTENVKEENGGFYLLPTTSISDVPASHFRNAQMFRTFRNIVIEKGCLGVATNYYYKLSFIDIFSNPDHPIMLVGNVSHLNAYKDNPERYVSCTFFCANEWLFHKGAIMQFPEDDKIYTSCSDAKHNINAGLKGYTDVSRMNPGEGDSGNFCFYSTTGEYIRVFVSQNAAKNYTVGNRKVYFTENYYNYVPEDLSVSIDDLQKTVDDLQKVIDELLKQIGNNTSEKEIMDLLKQILEELRNSGGGNGGGNGGGDINVDIDLSTTNGLLSKILAKVTQIFDKISTGSVDAVSAKLQETLDEILYTLKSIRRWTIADTVFDGLDALADIASFLKDFLTAPAAAIGTAASSLGDAADMLTDRFPFSIPWDMAALVTLLSAEPQAPVFKLPIVIESYGIEEYIEIDMSQYEYLSTIMRGMLSIIYAYGILSMTTKVIDTGGKK